MKRLPLLLALGGPALLGLWLAIRVESCGFAQGTIGLPLAVLATALISVPALYLGAAVFKAAPSPGWWWRASPAASTTPGWSCWG
ncbi:MAG: hypothetical protein R3F43_11875 [bacterium]